MKTKQKHTPEPLRYYVSVEPRAGWAVVAVMPGELRGQTWGIYKTKKEAESIKAQLNLSCAAILKAEGSVFP